MYLKNIKSKEGKVILNKRMKEQKVQISYWACIYTVGIGKKILLLQTNMQKKMIVRNA